MNNFCTLFDSFYLLKGLALYNSLLRQPEPFHLYIFAFDDRSFGILTRLNLAHATIIPLSELEDERLKAVKPGRTKGEYCWTSTTSTILYCLKKFNLASCTYIDADIFFFGSPQAALDQIGDKSVLMTEHHYAPEYDQSALSGKYCVQFMTFKNNAEGLKILNWWKDRVIEWCFSRREDGKFGDQKYLDDWTTRFAGLVAESKYWGAGVAPWNTRRFEFLKQDGIIKVRESGEVFNLVFYHFHDSQLYFLFNKLKIYQGSYVFNPSPLIKEIYAAYGKAINESWQMVRSVDPDFRAGTFSLNHIFEVKVRKIIFRLKRKIKKLSK
ncbi:MAG: glycosyl transferase [Patescibacteria group bacterium]|nr:glycosyl transferase [Patescibacteria group bacterium]